MSYHQELAEAANKSYNSGRKYEAALQYRHAAQAALEDRNLHAWFKHTVWAAVSYELSGDIRKALALLITARTEEPTGAPVYEAWIARVLAFTINYARHPDLATLEQQLHDIKGLSDQHSRFKSDVAFLAGQIYHLRGDLVNALASNETAWEAYDGEGYMKSGYAFAAAALCLRLHRFSAATGWSKATVGLDEEYGEKVAANQAEFQLCLELAQPDPSPTNLIAAVRILQDRYHGQTQRRGCVDELRELIARAQLLCPSEGDPASRLHPSRHELRSRWKNTQDVHARYSARLLLLDYRLACLRFSAGMSPVDDFYYSKPQSVPTYIPDTPELQWRLNKARAAIGWARSYATYLDGLLQCDYRTREVRAREDRVLAIVSCVDNKRN